MPAQKYTTPLAKLMRRAKLRSSDVEAICDVTRQSVHNWRAGINPPQIESVSLLMAALSKRGILTTIADFVPPAKFRGNPIRLNVSVDRAGNVAKVTKRRAA